LPQRPYDHAEAGDGGAGVRSSASTIGISRVVALGGKPGYGRDGQPGPDCEGCSRTDSFPYLDMSPDVVPGGDLVITINSIEPGLVLLLLSGKGGFLKVFGFGGPSLSAVPGSWFFVLPAGHSTGQDIVLSLLLPSDPVMRGVAINAQAAVLSSANYLSNATVRIVKE
jgi:hypothetical protein